MSIINMCMFSELERWLPASMPTGSRRAVNLLLFNIKLTTTVF
ncbi:hypothetical protein QUF64_07220 [Anaerolineales bacterium HSG6]|nr:hypothetical protein [Anaerolineales bacterium HSG6]